MSRSSTMSLAQLHDQLPFWQRSLVPFLLGGLYVLGFAPFHLWPFSAIAIIGLMLALDGAKYAKDPARAGFWRGWLFGLGKGLLGFYWLVNAFLVDAESFAIFAPFALFALAGGLALFWGTAAALYARFATGNWRRVFLFAAVFGLSEWLRATIFSGFPWNLPAHIWSAGGMVSQIASVVGASGLSVLTLFAFASLAPLINRTDETNRYLPVSITLVVFLVVIAAGAGRLHDHNIGVVSEVRLRIVHAQIPQQAKWQPENRDDVINRYLELSAGDGIETRSHVVWPENALPIMLLEEGGVLDRTGRAIGQDKILITGAMRRVSNDAGGETFFNALAALSFGDGVTQIEAVYDKQRLVPFGEFMPLAFVVSRLGIPTLAAIADGFTPGSQMASISLPGAPKVSPQICYEAIFAGFTPRGADRPGWILNISNDGWFGTLVGPRQFFNQSRYRAIEEGLPFVRAASGGISAVVDPYGRVIASRDAGDPGVVDATLPNALPPPLYALIGDVAIAVFLMIGFWVGLAPRVHRKTSSTNPG
jgi:apolipoprotein N-acyltransferase